MVSKNGYTQRACHDLLVAYIINRTLFSVPLCCDVCYHFPVTVRPARLTIVPSFVIQLFRISLSVTTLDSIERVNQAPTTPRLNSEFRRHPVLVSLLTLLRYVHIRIMVNISCSYHNTKRILASWHSSAVQSDTPVMGVT